MDENLDSKAWYLGPRSREEVEALLRQDNLPPHTYLIRKSKNVPEFIISYIKSGNRDIAHRKISFQNGRYWCSDRLHFPSILALVQYHEQCEGWLLYDKFSKSSINTHAPAPPGAAPVTYENSSSAGSCDVASLDSVASGGCSEVGSCMPLDANSMAAKLRRLLQIRSSVTKGAQTADVHVDARNIPIKSMLGNNLSNGEMPSNVVLTPTPDGIWPSEFYGGSQCPVDLTNANPNLTTQSYTNTTAFPAQGDRSRLENHHLTRALHHGNAAGSQINKAATLEDEMNLRMKIRPAGCSLSKGSEEHGDRSDWSLAHADVRKVGCLGAGNYGQVWKVVHIQSGKTFAMKTMKAATMKLDEFEREVKVMMTFRHPNLVKTYGVCSDPWESFILIDFLTNGSVIDYSKAVKRREKNPLSGTQKYHIAADVLKGMKYLSEENLIHRDLAARNVLLADDLTAKVADFGLALLANPDGGSEGHQSSMGTPWMWTAPEALRGRNKWSSKCDVWSYGVFCWELYTNCESWPYQPEHPNSRNLDQFLMSGGRLKMPEDCHISQLVVQCWAWEPEARPTFPELHFYMRALGPHAEL